MKREFEEDDPLWRDNNWFEEFSRMADNRLGEGSACAQIHPIVEGWFNAWAEREEADSDSMRASVVQALSCLATEVLNSSPQSILDVLVEHCDQDEVAEWIMHILAAGKAFQQALDNGELDDL